MATYEKYDNVQIPNVQLQTRLLALREIGKTTMPMGEAIRLRDTQQDFVTRIQRVQGLNNELIEQYGEKQDNGQYQVTPEQEGWADFVEAAEELNAVEFNAGQPYILYSRENPGAKEEEDDVLYGWSPSVKTPVNIVANTLADLGELLVIDGEDEDEDDAVVHDDCDEPEAVDDAVVGYIEPGDDPDEHGG